MKVTKRIGMPKSVLTLLAALLATVSGYSESSFIQWEFRGVVTESSLTSIPVGSPYSFEYSFDPSSFRVEHPLEHTAVYWEGWLNLGFPSSHVGFGGASLSLQVMNDLPISGEVADALWLKFSSSKSSETLLDGQDEGITLVSRSRSASAPPMTSTAFPVSFDLNDYSERYMLIRWGGPIRGTVDEFYINGNLVSQVVPEPSAGCLLGMAFLCLVFLPARMKRRRGTRFSPEH